MLVLCGVVWNPQGVCPHRIVDAVRTWVARLLAAADARDWETVRHLGAKAKRLASRCSTLDSREHWLRAVSHANWALLCAGERLVGEPRAAYALRMLADDSTDTIEDDGLDEGCVLRPLIGG